MDLTTSYPRSVKDKIAGVVMIARTADKAMDVAVFSFLNMDHEKFLQVVTDAKSDAEIEAFVKEHADKKTAEEIAAFNDHFVQYKPEPGTDSEKYFLELRAQVAPDRTDVTAWPDLLDLDEKRTVPKREAASV